MIASSGNAGSIHIDRPARIGHRRRQRAASDPNQSFPGANLTADQGRCDQWRHPPGDRRQRLRAAASGPFNLKVIFSAPNVISLGCSVAADQASGPILPNTYIVVARGTLRAGREGDLRPAGRSRRGDHGQQRGNAPPFEGKIARTPTTARRSS